jgi:hypothetical protein
MGWHLFFSAVNGLTTNIKVMQINGTFSFSEVNGFAIISLVGLMD